MGKICYIMGKSASGKDSVFKEIRKRRPDLKEIVLYTTRPIREGEHDGIEYHFVDEEKLKEFEEKKCVIEKRAYHTKCGIWKYFTVDDGQFDFEEYNYIMIGTPESYKAMRTYFGEEKMLPVYIEVEDGLRLTRALEREKLQREPKYAEMCRRFLADTEDFSEQNLSYAGIEKRFENIEFEKCLKEIGVYLQEKL